MSIFAVAAHRAGLATIAHLPHAAAPAVVVKAAHQPKRRTAANDPSVDGGLV
jgi:hypothetical protein